MKIRTKYCGIVDIEPKDVFEIWEGDFGDEEFTHTLRCRDVTGKYAHHVYGISTKAALKLSELSGKAISTLQFNEICDFNGAEKKENTLLKYA